VAGTLATARWPAATLTLEAPDGVDLGGRGRLGAPRATACASRRPFCGRAAARGRKRASSCVQRPTA
jgi:hypothetical protein